MIEHPVPQNITSYEFRLIGNMTIKQFLLLLIGGGIGFLFYSTNLPGFFKWPLVTTAVVSGIAMAFIPYEERTMDQWFINFIKAIYRPTKYYWRRVPKPPEFFNYTPIPAAMAESKQIDMTPYRRTQVKEFLSSLSGEQAAAEVDPLDLLSGGENMANLFAQVPAAADVTPGAQQKVSKPSLQTRPRPLRARTETVFVSSTSSVPSSSPTMSAPPPPPTAMMVAQATPQPVLTVEREEPKQTTAPAATPKPAEVAPIATVTVGRTQATEPTPTEEVAQSNQAQTGGAYLESTISAAGHSELSTLPAVFDKSLPFPSTAEKPNILIGMVHDSAKSIVPGAIVEILDSANNTVRAMKTNNVGQFYMSSPLKNGVYTIHTDKDGLTFPIYGFEATGGPLDPVDISASA